MKLFRFPLLFLALLTVFSTAAEAKIDLVPRKIVIEGRERSGELTILNLGDKPSTFRIDVVNMRQDENGVYKLLTTPLNPVFDPDKTLRLSPRQFTLPAGGRQKVRFSLRVGPDLPQGEYRFHLQAMELDDSKPDTSAKGATIFIHMNMGVSIPVIFRNGDLSATAKISNVTLVSADRTTSKQPELQMRIDRQGDASTIGGLAVFWEPQGGETRKISSIGNMNLFTDIKYRNVSMPLSEMPAGPGVIRVRYTNDGGKDKGQVFDEVVLQR